MIPRAVYIFILGLILGASALGCADDEPAACRVPRSADLTPGEVTGPSMRPGSNCLRCHAKDGIASNKPFSFGGTILRARDSEPCDGVAGVTIRVTDSEGRAVSVVSNVVGNFWSAERLVPPLRVQASRDGRTVVMPVETPTGGCALCHSWPDAVSGAAGRIRWP